MLCTVLCADIMAYWSCCLSRSLNEHGLFDYLLVNDDLEATASELERIAEVCWL